MNRGLLTTASSGKPAHGRPACQVAMDLRCPDRVAAVAVDAKGRLRGWVQVHGSSPRAMVSQAWQLLRIRAREVRVLIGHERTQFGVHPAPEPSSSEIAETLEAAGHPRLARPATAAWATATGEALVAAAQEEKLTELAVTLADLATTDPIFVSDQLLMAQLLEGRAAAVEAGDMGLSILARSPDSPWVCRHFPPPLDSPGHELRRTLDSARIHGELWFLGDERDALRRASSVQESEDLHEPDPLPMCQDEPLPAALELPWRLAAAAHVPALTGPVLERRQHSFKRARVVAWTGVALGLCGILLAVTGAFRWVGNRARNQDLRHEVPAVQAQVQQLRDLSVLVAEVRDLRVEAAGRSLDLPRVTDTLLRLHRDLPASVGWRRLRIDNGNLELQTVAFGPEAATALRQTRQILSQNPGIANPAWEETSSEDSRLSQQILRARLRPTSAREAGGPAGEDG